MSARSCLLLPTLAAATVLLLPAAGPATAKPRAHAAAKPAKRTATLRQRALQGRRSHGVTGWRQPAARPVAAPEPRPTAVVPAGSAPSAPAAAAPDLLAPVATLLSPAVPATTDPAVTTPTTPVAPPAPAVLGIQTSETPSYRMLLSRASVVAGPVRIQLKNTGEDPHNVLVVRTDGSGDAAAIPLTTPGGTTTQTVTLAPGAYRLYCTLTTPVVHETAGMRATLTVTP